MGASCALVSMHDSEHPAGCCGAPLRALRPLCLHNPSAKHAQACGGSYAALASFCACPLRVVDTAVSCPWACSPNFLWHMHLHIHCVCQTPMQGPTFTPVCVSFLFSAAGPLVFVLLGLGAYLGYTRGNLAGRQAAKGRWVYDRSLGGKKVRGLQAVACVCRARSQSGPLYSCIIAGALQVSRNCCTLVLAIPAVKHMCISTPTQNRASVCRVLALTQSTTMSTHAVRSCTWVCLMLHCRALSCMLP